MRDPNRIKPLLAKLEKAWLASPDLRLGQLISIFVGARDIQFNFEDDKMEQAIDSFLTLVSSAPPKLEPVSIPVKPAPLSSVDLRTCKIGDKLRSKHGAILTYMGPNPYGTIDIYPHHVKYPNTKGFGSNSHGTRTDDGYVMKNVGLRLESDHDIVEIIPKGSN